MSDSTRFDMHDVPTKPALEIAFSTAPGGKASHWKHDNVKNRVVLAWSATAGKDFWPFLVPMGPNEFYDMIPEIKNLLNYGSTPDIDGDASKSLRIYCEDWGHVDRNHYAFVAIEPFWALHGK